MPVTITGLSARQITIMVSVVDLKNRAIERLEDYRDNARVLPALVHARYIKPALLPTHKPKAAAGSYSMRKHKPHQMHTQHRASCVLVLQWLIKKMDIATRQCVFVNPKYGIRRTIYIPEIARHTGLCERTVTRVMDSITRARYLVRTVIGKTNQRYHYYVSDQLFRDLKLDISLRVLTGRLKGLDTKNAQESKAKAAAATSGTAPQNKPVEPNRAPAWKEVEKPYASQGKPTERELAIGNEFLANLRRRRPSPSG
ncbi:hypothetical protein [Stutzerimonas stutzeri]|uniref:hypothetical protein n=1 Tax=Stutzerimonas stutzeri TaxID=316 RepID=UPI0015E470F4|nr:hypothetical protein [Stutzerimonas stutzeri]MBA1280250.1 hypothetical protein [Stutzerimonas stutzeri]